MGRKVHPYGFRLGYIKDWKARWYAEKGEYAELLGEDLEVRKLIREQLGHAGISNIEIERFPRARQISVKIWTAKPGSSSAARGPMSMLCGRVWKSSTGKKVHVDVEEVDRPELDAYLVAEGIAQQIERRISYKRAMKQAVQRAMRLALRGRWSPVLGGCTVQRWPAGRRSARGGCRAIRCVPTSTMPRLKP